MALYKAGASTTMKATDTSMLFHPSPKITGRVMAPSGYVVLPGKPMRGKSTRFKSLLDLPIFSKASRNRMSVELPPSIRILFMSHPSTSGVMTSASLCGVVTCARSSSVKEMTMSFSGRGLFPSYAAVEICVA